MKHLTIRNTGKAVTIGTRIVPAIRSWHDCSAFSERPTLNLDVVLIRPSSGVHTRGMLFPIDVVALDKLCAW